MGGAALLRLRLRLLLLLLLLLVDPFSAASALSLPISAPSSLFTFDFFNLTSSASYLGVYYNPSLVSPLTSVWIANRNSSVPPSSSSSTFNLSSDGLLRLFDGDREVWHSPSSAPAGANATLELLDSGNLVLLRSNRTIAWQSFDDPGETWLPGMSLGPNKKLTSWRNPSDPTPGPYSLIMGNNSNFVLVYDAGGNGTAQRQTYWDSGSWNGAIFSNVPEMTANYIFNFSFNTTTGFTWSVYPDQGADYNISRFVIQDDGLIAESSYAASQRSWNIFWTKPNQPCDVVRYCGADSICNNDVSPHCSCPSAAFVPANTAQWSAQIFYQGCRRNSSLLACSAASNSSAANSSSYGFLSINKTTFSGWTSFQSQTLQDVSSCRNACLSNCSCDGFFYLPSNGGAGIGNCSFFSGSLYDGTIDSTAEGTYYLRALAADLASGDVDSIAPLQSNSSQKSASVTVIIGCITAAVLLVAIISCAAACWAARRRRLAAAAKAPEAGLRAFSYAELQAATKGFKDKLGAGGFGTVYRGVVGGGNGGGGGPSLAVAVKKLHRLDEGEKQFRAEVRTIGTIQHVNLVRLLGFCSEGKHRLLVYEMAENGSLDGILFGKRRRKEAEAAEEEAPPPLLLPWERRFSIALGAARGLAYLHESCRECIIHCDIKPENILLDAAYAAKVADFGMAKLVGREFSHVLTTLRGTRGYLAPEWIAGMPITAKADVYSFGMTMLELVSGKRNIQEGDAGALSTFFPLSAAQLMHLPDGDLSSLVDPRLQGKFDMDDLRKLLYCAIWCIQDNEDSRPSMGKVVQILEGSITIDIPPIPVSLQCLLEADSFVKMPSAIPKEI